MKTDKNNMIISELTPQNDQLKKKAKELNEVLMWQCNKRNIGVIKCDNKNARGHCNMSGLYLNWKGTNILTENILLCSNKLCSSWLESKVSENSKKSAQFELILKQNTSNSDLTKELDKDKSCLKKTQSKTS